MALGGNPSFFSLRHQKSIITLLLIDWSTALGAWLGTAHIGERAIAELAHVLLHVGLDDVVFILESLLNDGDVTKIGKLDLFGLRYLGLCLLFDL